jgi:hypothetical protein
MHNAISASASRTALVISNCVHRISLIRRLLPLSKLITRDIAASHRWLKNAGIWLRGWIVAASSVDWEHHSDSMQACGNTGILAALDTAVGTEFRLTMVIGEML